MQAHIIGARAGRLMAHILPQIGACHRAGIPVVLFVPEQYTLQAERELVTGLKLPGLMDIEVLSPRRLARRIRENGGRSPLTPLDAAGRSMALAQALTTVQDQLTYYQRVALTPALPEKMSVLLADLQRSGLTPEQLFQHAQSQGGGALKAKAADVALVWQEYLTLLEGRFADETMQQRELISRVRGSGVLTGAALFVYGFDVIPQPMAELICEAAEELHSLTVTMTMDAREVPDGRIFETQRRSASDLMNLLKTHGIPVEWRYLPIVEDHARVAALQHLERHLFTRRIVKFEGDASPLSIHAAATPYAEAVHIAHQLMAWHEAGVPWQRMAIAMADANAMPGILAVTLKAAGIPHYVARKDSASRHGLCRMLLGALRAATGGYATLDVLTMAKSGFSPLTAEEAYQLENYARSNGIDHGRWTKPFTRGNFAAEEGMRTRLIAPVERLRENLRAAKSATQSAEAIFALLQDVGAYERLIERENELLRRGMQAEAAQNRQVWQLVMELLDQLHALLGEKRAAMKDVARFVSSGLTGASISSLPPQVGEVMIGEAGHLLTGDIDALVLCGMQDGVLGTGMSSLITEAERHLLSEAMHCAIGLTQVETAALRQSDFYRTMALPRKHLHVTYAQGAQDGKALRPSALIDDMREMFGVAVTGGVLADGSDEPPLSPQLALDGLALRLRDVADGRAESLAPSWEEALRRLWHSAEWHDRTERVIAGAAGNRQENRLPQELTRRIFRQDEVSITRLEKFAGCPYQHFVDYGLKPVQRKEWEFNPVDAGNFYHAALEGYAKAALEHPGWPDLPDEEIDALMDGVLTPLVSAWNDGPLQDTPAGQLLGEKYMRTAKRAAWLFTRHAKGSSFKTLGQEITFGRDGLPPIVLQLESGARISLQGKIDRVDGWMGPDGKYLRVIDYKSSQRELDPTRLWYGLQLQLMLYLQVAAQGYGGQAAGAFYFTVKDPLVEAEDVKEAAEKAIADTLKLKGVALSDIRVVSAMDADGTALGELFKKDGAPRANAAVFTKEEMDALLQHTQLQAAKQAQGILAGDISVSPAQLGDWNPCQYCAYQAVCGIDPSRPDCTARVLPAIRRQELTAMLANDKDTDA